MDAIFSTLLSNSGSRTGLRLASAVLSTAALLLAAGWLLWSSGPAQAQVTGDARHAVKFTASIGRWTNTVDDVVLTGLELPKGATIAPEFSTSTYSYALTVPVRMRQLGFSGRFTSQPYWCGKHQDRSQCPGFGLAMVGTPAQLVTEIDNNNAGYIIATDQWGPFDETSTFDLTPSSTTTIAIRVYKRLPGRAQLRRLHDPQNSVWRDYTLTVNVELPAEDDTGLYDLAISDGWLDFDPDATSYKVYVTRDTESVVLTPTTMHPQATVTVNGSDPATAVDLNKGGNDIPIVVTAADGMATTTYQVTVFRGATHDYSAFIAQMYEWRNRPEWVSYKEHTDRWDRALLAFGETVDDTTLTPLTAAEAQAFADRGSDWHRWISVADALRDLEASRAQRRQQEQRQQQATSTADTVPQDSDPPNWAPVVASVLPDVTDLTEGETQEVSLSGVFDDADGDSLTITAGSSNESVATVSVESDHSTLTLEGVSEGAATITVTAQDTDGSRVSDAFDVSVVGKYAALIAQMYEWRNDPQWGSHKPHTDRWDRALLAFGETVSDSSITPMTAAEAQALADQDWGTRWVPVAAALWEIESEGQQQQDPPNRAPTVSAAIADITIVNQSGTKQVSLSGVFSDADNDSLTITAGSSNESVATVAVESGGSSLTVTARARGTATITVTADDGNGGTVSDVFTVRVKAAPTVASSLADVTGLEAGATRDVSLSGVFDDGDGDTLTITAGSSNESVATVSVASGGSTLTVTGAAQGAATITLTARDSDGNRVSDTFDVSVSRAPEPDPTPTPTPEPTPTPTPTPEPAPEPETSDIVSRYDANGDGAIDVSEYSQAARDYTAGKITYAELLEVIRAYMGSG